MIPADVASRLRLVLPDQPAPPQPAAPAQKLADVLGDLVPGQRLMAEIQALLPNGTYRAVVAQRDITLALPFTAKPGDSLELEVVDHDGRLALAVVANRTAGAPAERPAVATTLSPAGQLIGDLLGNVEGGGKRAAPAPLNGNQPLVTTFPDDPAELAPLLKDAVARSGVFYEANQARWVKGDLPTETLLQQPQGKHSPLLHEAPPPLRSAPPEATPAATVESPRPAAASGGETTVPVRSQAAAVIPPDLTPIVQQQLDGLATQNFVWQGQAWPGQAMEWSIEEDGPGRSADGEIPEQWKTSLRLTLPHLGEVSATLQIRGGNDLELALAVPDAGSREALGAALPTLRRSLENAGLRLTAARLDDGQQTG